MYIQMVTALVLQLIQCVVHLPSDKDIFDEYDSKVGEHAHTQTHHTKQANTPHVYTNTYSDILFSSTFARLTSSFFFFQVDQDVLITNSYETAMRTAQNFLSVFLKK